MAVSDVVAECCENFVNYQVDIHQNSNKFHTNKFHTNKFHTYKLHNHKYDYTINKFYSQNGDVCNNNGGNEGGGDGDGYDSWAC